MKGKILLHIISIFLVLFGLVTIHILIQSYTWTIYITFFGIQGIHRNFVLDLSIVLIGIAFFIEFYLTFKPIKILKDK